MFRQKANRPATLDSIVPLSERIEVDPACDLAAWRAEVSGRDNRSEQVHRLTGPQVRAMVTAQNPEGLAVLPTGVRQDAAAELLGHLDPHTAAAALAPLSLSQISWILRKMGDRRDVVLDAIAAPDRQDLYQLLRYPA